MAASTVGAAANSSDQPKNGHGNGSSSGGSSSSGSGSSSFRSQLLQRLKGVCIITLVVSTGLHTYPPLLALLIVGFIADEYYRMVQQQITNLHTYSAACITNDKPSTGHRVEHHVAVVEPRKRAAYVAMCVVICVGSLWSHESLTGVALLLSLLLLTFLLFHLVEHADTRSRVPLSRRADSACDAVAQLVDSEPVSGHRDDVPARAPPPPAVLLLHPSPLASAHEFCTVVLLVFGLWYCGWMFAHGVLVLRHPSGYAHSAHIAAANAAAAGSSLESCGISRVVYVIFVTAGGENGGMFLGKLLGRSKFTPRISPNKSREGALAQLLTSALVSLACAAWMDVDIPIVDSLWLGFLLGFVGCMGDLFESFLKRSVGVKDAGSMIPGAGGMLDRMDGLIFNFPAFYFYLQYAHATAAAAAAAAK